MSRHFVTSHVTKTKKKKKQDVQHCVIVPSERGCK